MTRRPMRLRDLPVATRRERVRWALIPAACIAVALLAAWWLQSAMPRHIVLASGLRDGIYHQYAQRYKEILGREGVTVEERMTGGAEENERLLRDPKSGVDVAFMHGGVVRPSDRGKLIMLATLYYELVPLVNLAALRALQAGQVDAAFLVGPAQFPAIWQALHDPELKLMSLARADAYPRIFPYITKLTLPPGTIDLALHIPDQEVDLIGTKAMLVARDDLPPAIINLLLEAGRELHGQQGFFEADGEFPNTAPVDLPVSADANRHHRFGPSLLHRYLPFVVAAYVERLIVLLVPIVFVIVPLSNLLPRLFRWRMRSRIYRWYGELAMLERDVRTRTGALPIEQWLSDLGRIEHAAARIRTPMSYASEAYTLREHIGLVRQAVMAKAQDVDANANASKDHKRFETGSERNAPQPPAAAPQEASPR